MGRVCYGPSLSWAEFVMGRDVPESMAHIYITLSIPEAGETVETPVKRYCNIGKVPIRTQNQDGCVHTG